MFVQNFYLMYIKKEKSYDKKMKKYLQNKIDSYIIKKNNKGKS